MRCRSEVIAGGEADGLEADPALCPENNRVEDLTPQSGHYLATMRRANQRDLLIIVDSRKRALSRRKERRRR